MSFFPVEMLGTLTDHQPFPDSAAKGFFPSTKKGKQFPFQSFEITGKICLTDCNYVTSGRILGCDFSKACPGVHAGLQIILGVTASSIERARLQCLPGKEGEGLVDGPWNPFGSTGTGENFPGISPGNSHDPFVSASPCSKACSNRKFSSKDSE
jgi:hypothetical protein